MGRRAPGVLLVIAVIIAALLAPSIAGRRIAGIPTALLVPRAPEIGDCLAATVRDIRSSDAVPLADDAAPQLVPCSSEHAGEIISVDRFADFPTITRGAAHYPDLSVCARASHEYLGVRSPTEVGDRSEMLGPWNPASMGSYGFLSPTPLQRRAGQSWLACVLSSSWGPVSATTAGIYSGEGRANPLAVCRPGISVLLDVSIACREPHRMEIFGWRVADESVGGKRPLDESCVALVSRATGMSDITAGGALQVATIVIHYDAHGNLRDGWGPGPHSERNRAACTVSPSDERKLAGSLTGLGVRPVPWAN